MPTWTEFAWAALFYKAMTHNDECYQKLMRSEAFLRGIRENPSSVSIDEIREKLIRGFLNPWKTRITDSEQVASGIKARIVEIQAYLDGLSHVDIYQVDFDRGMTVGRKDLTVAAAIGFCYSSIDKAYDVGPTATAKILHILLPQLYVMWDTPIIDDFKKNHVGVSTREKGYIGFLRIMKQYAIKIAQSFQETRLFPPVQGETPEQYLSARLEYPLQKTMTKLLDEYNWVTITNGVELPPAWYPAN